MAIYTKQGGVKKTGASVFAKSGGVKKEVVEAYRLVGGAKALVYQHELPRQIGTLTENGIFCMFHMPAATRYQGAHNRTYIGFYTNDAEVRIKYWDNDSGVLSGEVVLWTGWSGGGQHYDDHNVPSVVVLQHQTGDNAGHNGKILVASAEHNARMQSRRSVNTEDITAWEDAVVMETDLATYAKLCETTDGVIWVSYRYRTGEMPTTHEEYYRTSADGGATWSDRVHCATFGGYDLEGDWGRGVTYTMIDQYGQDIHFMFNSAAFSDPPGNPSAYYDIYYIKWDGETGQWQKADGTQVTLPLTTDNADLVYYTPRPVDENKTFKSDIVVYEGEPYLLSLDGPYESFTEHTVQRHHWNGTEWITERLEGCLSGTFGNYGYRSYAVLSKASPSQIFAAVGNNPDNKPVEIQDWRRGSNGTWTKHSDITTGSVGDNFRPTTVRNGDKFILMWCYTEHYEQYWDDWDSKIYYMVEG